MKRVEPSDYRDGDTVRIEYAQVDAIGTKAVEVVWNGAQRDMVKVRLDANREATYTRLAQADVTVKHAALEDLAEALSESLSQVISAKSFLGLRVAVGKFLREAGR